MGISEISCCHWISNSNIQMVLLQNKATEQQEVLTMVTTSKSFTYLLIKKLITEISNPSNIWKYHNLGGVGGRRGDSIAVILTFFPCLGAPLQHCRQHHIIPV